MSTPNEWKKSFRLEPLKPGDKHILIHGPGGLKMSVDYDDVNHGEVKATVERMLTTLNDQWWRRTAIGPLSDDEIPLPPLALERQAAVDAQIQKDREETRRWLAERRQEEAQSSSSSSSSSSLSSSS